MPVNPALYNGVIPQSTDLLSISQGQILNNFGAIQSLIDTDHVDFASGTATAGQHDRISFTVQTSPPAQNLPNRANWVAGQVGMYSALNAVTNKNELYINKTNQATVTQIPATASVLSVTSAPAALSSGWTYLPSGILLKWAANVVANGQTVITFPVGANIPAFTTCITVLVQIANGGAGDVNQAIRLTGVNPTTFNVYGSNRTTTGATAVTFTYLAIGY